LYAETTGRTPTCAVAQKLKDVVAPGATEVFRFAGVNATLPVLADFNALDEMLVMLFVFTSTTACQRGDATPRALVIVTVAQ